MKERVIKMKSYMGNVNIVDNNDLKSKTLNFILCSFGFLALSYAFLIGNMVFNIVERKSLESQARNISSEVRELELTYLNESNKIDLVFAESLGFKESFPSYATRKPIGLNISVKDFGNEL